MCGWIPLDEFVCYSSCIRIQIRRSMHTRIHDYPDCRRSRWVIWTCYMSMLMVTCTDMVIITFRWVDHSQVISRWWQSMKKSGAFSLRQWWKQTQFSFLKRSSYNHVYSTKSTTKRTVWDLVAFNQKNNSRSLFMFVSQFGCITRIQASDKQTNASSPSVDFFLVRGFWIPDVSMVRLFIFATRLLKNLGLDLICLIDRNRSSHETRDILNDFACFHFFFESSILIWTKLEVTVNAAMFEKLESEMQVLPKFVFLNPKILSK